MSRSRERIDAGRSWKGGLPNSPNKVTIMIATESN